MITHKMFISELSEENQKEIAKALYDVWGVRDVTVNAAQNEVEISFNEKAGALHDFEQAVIDLGYSIKHLG